MGMRSWTAVPGAVALAVLLSGCSREPSTKAAEPASAAVVRVRALRAQPQAFAAVVDITGTLISRASVTVKAETTGRVLRVTKDEGDRVQAGEPVVYVDDSHEKLAARQAESAVMVAEAALERAKVLEAHSRSEWTRAQNLLKSGGITDRDYKAAEIATRDAAAQISLMTAQLEQAKAQVATVRKALQESIVRSPVAGEIQAKITAEGAYVEPPTPVFAVVDNTQLELESMVATADLGSVHAGQTVRFAVNTFPGQQFEGRVIEVNPAIQAETRSGKVRIRVANPGGRLKAGMFAEGQILTDAQRRGILLPSDAVYRDDRSSNAGYVFLLAGGRATRRNVNIGSQRDSMLEIAAGLNAGDVVASEQSIELADGVRVEPALEGDHGAAQ